MNLNLNFDGDTKLKDWWKTVKSNFQNIKSDFENEVSTRANADSELRNIIDAETAARTNVDDKLNSAISSEINSRKTADNELSSAIYDEKVERSREITRIENIVYSESEQFSDLLSGLYFYEKSIKLSECASEAYGWYTLAEEVPENVLFFVENDTDTAISEFREYDSAAIKLGTPIDAGETRLCVLTKRETVGVDLSKDGYIFVLDEGVLSKAATEALAEKQDKVTGGASTIVSSNLTANRAVVSDSSGKVSVSAVTGTELGYLDGVTSNVQTQLESKAPKNHASTATTYGTGTASSYGHLKLSNSVSSTSSTSSGVAATPYAVKQAYDLAKEVQTDVNNLSNDFCTNGYAGGEEITADLHELQSAFYSGIFAGAAEVVDAVTDLSHTASNEEYFTGKWWLDGSPIYRRDFCIQVVNTSMQWQDKEISWSELFGTLDITLINSNAKASYDSVRTIFCTSLIEGFDVTTTSYGIEWTGEPNGSMLNIWGYIEYCKTGHISSDNVIYRFE